MRRYIWIPALGIYVFMTGCATLPYQPYAREVKKKPETSGVIALNGTHRPEDRAKAEMMMKSNCGANNSVKVTEEGEVVVGEKTDSTAQKTQGTAERDNLVIGGLTFTSSQPAENTTVTQHKTQVKEWQIAYECIAQQPSTIPNVATKKGAKKKR